jgi:predicted porin
MGRLFHFYGDLRMKKSLFALAALTAVAGAAQAQSSVTLYGALDAGLYYGNKVSTTGQDLNMAFVDSSIVSSVWGLKGSEDLGSGMKANFNAESDIQLNNGGMNQNGLFRRQANVGLSDVKYGALDLGVKTNPFIAAHGLLMPVSGNSVSTNIAMSGGYSDFFTRNAVTYTSPVWAGFQAQAQVGLGNTAGENGGGNVYAASAAYTGINNLTVRAAYQNRVMGTSNSAANYSGMPTGLVGVPNTMFSDVSTTGKTSYLAGLQYKLGAFTLAYGYAHNARDRAKFANGSYVQANNQFGVSYQATPKVLLGATYMVGTMDQQLVNAQARYSVSPRTTAYAQLGVATNGAYAAIVPVQNQTGTQPASSVSGYGPQANQTQSAFGLGVIHTF